MRKRFLFGSGLVALAFLVTLLVWQGSFTFGEYAPSGSVETNLFWAVSTLVFLLTVTLGFMLFRTGLRLYVERQTNREGSRIKTRLVVGALTLSFMPVFFLVLWGVHVLNRNLDKWFSRPAEGIRITLQEVGTSLGGQVQARAMAEARRLALLDAVGGLNGRACRDANLAAVLVERPNGTVNAVCGWFTGEGVEGVAELEGGGRLRVKVDPPIDLARKEQEIREHIREYDQLAANKKRYRDFYLLMMILITLFILFVATWIALFLARQISTPISALLEASEEVRKGNLSYRIETKAIDELATLVRAFNDMTHDLEANRAELERRRRFTEAILESIPTGVLSLGADGSILRVNPALRRILPEEKVARASRLEDLFSRDDTAEIKYLMKRARRTGLASRPLELKIGRQTLQLSATVSSLEDKLTSGFVLVLEDTSELLRAQKVAAWHEVARRIAHEIKNPLTPIALCAERIGRHLDRSSGQPGEDAILRECATTIASEVQSLKTLVDEFSQFARFPAAQPVPANLNEVVENALAVFAGRLEDIEINTFLSPDLPMVNVDKEQFKRVIVNLVDNAAEAMQESPLKRLWITTQASSAETVELMIADTGCGIAPEEKEKLFLPYFSTKGRGTGLGLAIVNRILLEHNAHIRVEDNLPVGARFLIEIPALAATRAEPRPVEAGA
jgi:two-component system, NtrC family, nitrogen regulation sensor histidine kinase NtrY